MLLLAWCYPFLGLTKQECIGGFDFNNDQDAIVGQGRRRGDDVDFKVLVPPVLLQDGVTVLQEVLRRKGFSFVADCLFQTTKRWANFLG